MSACDKVVMKFPFNTDSYHNEPDEWISSFAVDDYIDRRIKLGFPRVIPICISVRKTRLLDFHYIK